MNPPDLIVFYGRGGASAAERLVADARLLVTRQLLADAVAEGIFRRILVLTNEARLTAAVPVGVDVERTPDRIDFGELLTQTVRRLGSEAVVYVGGGSAPLLDGAGLRDLVASVAEPGFLRANNYLSSDYVAFRPATALEHALPIRNDNDLAWRLYHDAGLARVAVERTIAAMLDLDTPTDLALLRMAPDLSAPLRDFLDTNAPLLPALDAVERVMANPAATLIVAGRLNTQLWTAIEGELAFLRRLFVEERGMRANGREERGEVRSLLGYLLREVGPVRFFDYLADLGDALVFDTRPLFAHLAPQLSAADRFASDLLRPDDITDPLVREFTRAARDTSLPVVLGGHTLVTGGLWLVARRARLAKELVERQAGAP